MKRKKLTSRQKAVNRIKRRLKTLENKGVELRINPTKKNIEEVLRANRIRITKDNINEIVNDAVQSSQYTTKEQAKTLKKIFGLKNIKEVQKLSGQDLHNKIAAAFDESDELGEEALEAYGY